MKWVPEYLESNPICELRLPISVMVIGPFFGAQAKPEPNTNTPWLRYICQGLFCTVPFFFLAVGCRKLLTTVLGLEHCWSKRTQSVKLWIRSSPGLINDAGKVLILLLTQYKEDQKFHFLKHSNYFTFNDSSSARRKIATGMKTEEPESLSLTGLTLEGHDTGNLDLNSTEIMQSGLWSWAM